MSNPTIKTEDAKPKKVGLEDVCTPIFDAEMGRRLRLMRMRRLLDQKELAEMLAIKQSTVSDLELGILSVPRHPFTVAHLKEIFGVDTGFILYGTNPERFSPAYIMEKFHEKKFKVNRKPRADPHWQDRATKSARARAEARIESRSKRIEAALLSRTKLVKKKGDGGGKVE